MIGGGVGGRPRSVRGVSPMAKGTNGPDTGGWPSTTITRSNRGTARVGSVADGSSMVSVLEETSADRGGVATDRGGVAGTGVLLRHSRKCLMRKRKSNTITPPRVGYRTSSVVSTSAVSFVVVSLIEEIPSVDFSIFFLRDSSSVSGIHRVTSGAPLSLDGMIPKKQVSPCLKERNKTKWKF